ncbi:MAG: MBL fold metallo-hydrolase [Dysgonamonadaceae bacterium]|jgi:metallo-beta-lactamase family protein|nr:MBL fold metallo-hydrolase [Dysgonamonadaceae bacterium]
MKITFHGAAGTVTGSRHLLTLSNGKQILLDCGMFQGLGKATIPLNKNLGFDATAIHSVVLSHAHVDHSGLLPLLVKQGFQGKIYATPATIDVVRLLLLDSAYIQEQDAKFINKKLLTEGKRPIEPLYREADARKTFDHFHPLPYQTPVCIDDDVEVQLFDCGHIIGSATLFLKIRDNAHTSTLAFSGDVGRYGDPILRSPQAFPQADYIIIESTYGDKLHKPIDTYANDLKENILETCIGKKGKLIIPAFSVGRTQELLYALNELELNHQLPPIKYYVDSPLSTEITMAVKRHPECFNKSVQKLMTTDSDPFMFKGLTFITDKRDSQALNTTQEACVIISASGMAEAGRVKHHIANSIENWRNTILLIGYCEPHSLGARLKARPETVGIFGASYNVKASINTIDSMSAHADYNDLCQYLASQHPSDVKQLFVVHGEPEVQDTFKSRLLKKGFRDVIIPQLGETFGL